MRSILLVGDVHDSPYCEVDFDVQAARRYLDNNSLGAADRTWSNMAAKRAEARS